MISSWSYAKNLSLYYATYVAVALAILCALYLLANSSVHIRPAPLVQYNTYECIANPDIDGDVFNLLAYSEVQAISYSDSLCEDAGISQRYHKVTSIWQHRDLDNLRVIFDKPFDLMTAKPELIERPEINLVDSYVPIAEYDSYDSYLISLTSMPQLNAEYLQGKSLALLDSPSSMSGHNAPRQAIKNAGIDEKILTIKYYNTHFDSYRALVEGEVDIVATGMVLPEGLLQQRKHHIFPIQQGLRSPRWYLHPSLIGSQVHCSVLDMLESKSSRSVLMFEKNLIALEVCKR